MYELSLVARIRLALRDMTDILNFGCVILYWSEESGLLLSRGAHPKMVQVLRDDDLRAMYKRGFHESPIRESFGLEGAAGIDALAMYYASQLGPDAHESTARFGIVLQPMSHPDTTWSKRIFAN